MAASPVPPSSAARSAMTLISTQRQLAMKLRMLLGAAIAALAMLTAAASTAAAALPNHRPSHHPQRTLADLRKATAKFHSIAVAEQGGYALLTDTPSGRDGTLTLAAVEYVVVKAAWDAGHARPP